jgi:hypothetical protein
MATVKRLALSMALGALAGVAVASAAGPSYVVWHNTPSSGGAMCECVRNTRDAVDSLIAIQGAGLALGALGGLGLGGFLAHRRKRLAAASPAPPPANPPAA